MLLKIFETNSKVAKLRRLPGLRRAFVEDFPCCPQSYKVTEVMVLLQIFKNKFRGCEVAEVTTVAQGFC